MKKRTVEITYTATVTYAFPADTLDEACEDGDDGCLYEAAGWAGRDQLHDDGLDRDDLVWEVQDVGIVELDWE